MRIKFKKLTLKEFNKKYWDIEKFISIKQPEEKFDYWDLNEFTGINFYRDELMVKLITVK